MYPPSFMKARTVAFACVLTMSFIWAIVLCVVAFLRWDVSSSLERSLIVIMLLTNAITVIMMPLLLLLKFRVWLDVPRLLLLLVFHIGSAVALAYCNANFACPPSDQQGTCHIINICILVCCWINPALLLAYAAGLAYMLYHRSKRTTGQFYVDVESSTSSSQRSTRDMIQADRPSHVTGEVPVFVPVLPSSNNRRSSLPWLSSSTEGGSRLSLDSPHLAKPPIAWTGTYAI